MTDRSFTRGEHTTNKEANRERLNACRLAWRKSKEGYAEKQRQYKKSYNQKQFFMAEVRRLLNIQII